MTTVDIDKDSHTDILLVGAPMFMGTEKEEQGKVYVYSVSQVKGEVSPGKRVLSLRSKYIMQCSTSTVVGKRGHDDFRVHHPLCLYMSV